MSKHLGPLLKLDNTGVKWYRKVANVGDTMISANTLCEFAYAANNSTYRINALPSLSGDYNLVRPFSGQATAYKAGRVTIAGVASNNISTYNAIVHTGLQQGWVQFKGIAPISSRCAVTAGSAVIPSSSTNATGIGHIMMAAGIEDAMSAGIGLCVSSHGVKNGNGWTWVYLTLP